MGHEDKPIRRVYRGYDEFIIRVVLDAVGHTVRTFRVVQYREGLTERGAELVWKRLPGLEPFARTAMYDSNALFVPEPKDDDDE